MRLLLVVLLTAAALDGAEGQEKTGSHIIKHKKKGSQIIEQKRKGKHFKIRIKVQKESEWDEEALKAIEWGKVKGEHFLVYFVAKKKGSEGQKVSADLSGEKGFANAVLRRSERYYIKIPNGLGYRRLSGFWTWDNRVKIYVYPSNVALIKVAGRPGWSAGATDYTSKTIFGHHSGSEEEFLNNILPHELGHLIFRDFIGFTGEVPLWLDEGVAQLQEGGGARRRVARRKSLEILWKDRLLPLKDLAATDGKCLQKQMALRAVWEFYIQALSLVDFMLVTGGKGNFEKFCRHLRKGKSLNESLKFSYPTSIRNTEELEKEWVRYITEEK